MFLILLSILWGVWLRIELVPIATASQIDVVDDLRTLGYPDSRKVIRDQQGKLYVAYRKGFTLLNTQAQHIFVAQADPAGALWTTVNGVRPIETVGDYVQRVPSLAIDSHDVLHVVWYGLDEHYVGENERQIKYTYSQDHGASWASWRNLAPIEGYQGESLWQEHPVITIDDSDNLYVVWEGKDTAYTKTQIKFVRSTDGGHSWSNWINVAPTSEGSFSRPTIAATQNGNFLYVVAYANFAAEKQIVWTSSTDAGATWAPWAFVAADQRDQRHISIALDQHNQLHAVWRQRPAGSPSGSTTQLFYSVLVDGAWQEPRLIAPDPLQNQFFPSITVNDQDQVWVAWLATESPSGYPTEDPDRGRIYYTHQQDGQWFPAQRLNSSETALYPTLRLIHKGGNQTLDIVWLEHFADYYLALYHDTINSRRRYIVTVQ